MICDRIKQSIEDLIVKEDRTLDEDALISAMMIVLEHYSTKESYDEFCDLHKGELGYLSFDEDDVFIIDEDEWLETDDQDVVFERLEQTIMHNEPGWFDNISAISSKKQ